MNDELKRIADALEIIARALEEMAEYYRRKNEDDLDDINLDHE